MTEVFEYLEKIKKVEPNTNLYAKTLSEIKRQNVIPLFWVRAVACLLIAFISTEFYFSLGKSHSNSKDISSVIYQTNNILYNE